MKISRWTLFVACILLSLPMVTWGQMPAASPVNTQPATTMEGNPHMIIHTNFGQIHIELYADRAPETVKNFVEYVNSGFYENTLFHRVIPNFMIQGGGFDVDFKQKPTNAPVTNEANNGLSNTRGTLAMARTMDPHSATAQFFINVQDNPFLDHQGTHSGQAWGYAVFGEVTDGMDVVDAIKAVRTGPKAGHQDVPIDPVIIERIEIDAEA